MGARRTFEGLERDALGIAIYVNEYDVKDDDDVDGKEGRRVQKLCKHVRYLWLQLWSESTNRVHKQATNWGPHSE